MSQVLVLCSDYFFIVSHSPILVSCLCIMSCVMFLFFHALLCLLSFKFSCGLPSVSLCLSALFPPGLLLCAPPCRYHTWLPPSSLSSPVPRLVISVCVFSLCVPFTPCPVIVCILSLVVHAPVSCLVGFGFSFAFLCMFDLNFVILLCYFVSSLVATLFFVPICLLLVFVNSF